MDKLNTEKKKKSMEGNMKNVKNAREDLQKNIQDLSQKERNT